jgi:hypothetical protein
LLRFQEKEIVEGKDDTRRIVKMDEISRLKEQNKELKMELDSRFLQVTHLMDTVKGLELEKKQLQKEIDGWVTTNQELVSVYARRNETLRTNFLSLLRGLDIAELIEMWARRNKIHPDDFDSLFVPELLEMLEEDN